MQEVRIAKAYLPARSELNPFTPLKANQASVDFVKSCGYFAVNRRLAGLVTGEPERLFWYKALIDVGYDGGKIRLHGADRQYERVCIHLCNSGSLLKTWDL